MSVIHKKADEIDVGTDFVALHEEFSQINAGLRVGISGLIVSGTVARMVERSEELVAILTSDVQSRCAVFVSEAPVTPSSARRRALTGELHQIDKVSELLGPTCGVLWILNPDGHIDWNGGGRSSTIRSHPFPGGATSLDLLTSVLTSQPEILKSVAEIASQIRPAVPGVARRSIPGTTKEDVRSARSRVLRSASSGKLLSAGSQIIDVSAILQVHRLRLAQSVTIDELILALRSEGVQARSEALVPLVETDSTYQTRDLAARVDGPTDGDLEFAGRAVATWIEGWSGSCEEYVESVRLARASVASRRNLEVTSMTREATLGSDYLIEPADGGDAPRTNADLENVPVRELVSVMANLRAHRLASIEANAQKLKNTKHLMTFVSGSAFATSMVATVTAQFDGVDGSPLWWLSPVLAIPVVVRARSQKVRESKVRPDDGTATVIVDSISNISVLDALDGILAKTAKSAHHLSEVCTHMALDSVATSDDLPEVAVRSIASKVGPAYLEQLAKDSYAIPGTAEARRLVTTVLDRLEAVKLRELELEVASREDRIRLTQIDSWSHLCTYGDINSVVSQISPRAVAAIPQSILDGGSEVSVGGVAVASDDVRVSSLPSRGDVVVLSRILDTAIREAGDSTSP